MKLLNWFIVNTWGGKRLRPHIWFIQRRNSRRERLVRKWDKTLHFKKQAISLKYEAEFMSRVPQDGKWHHIALTVMANVKRNKNIKDLEESTYLDGVKIADVAVTDKSKLKIYVK